MANGEQQQTEWSVALITNDTSEKNQTNSSLLRINKSHQLNGK